uniref:Uncharacterized protein n=1 Tax=Aureoumbra lagunensis TaxID=44058 RepID=A0A7S3NJK7_9STRA|mmetsp:Transcript_12027/g.18049  ORF Transcript_12027/g.18049 Transcript_12027/m.18049 type:complete len:392 (+) Transcript_12027:41-1216(+)
MQQWTKFLGSPLAPYKEKGKRALSTYLLGLGVLFWYGIAGYIVTRKWRNIPWLSWSNQTVAWLFAFYMVSSQAFLLFLVWLILPRAIGIRAVQKQVLLATIICIPADTITILAEPIPLLATVFVFFIVTFYFGFLIVHFFKIAIQREEQEKRHPLKRRTLLKTESTLDIALYNLEDKVKSLLDELRTYIPAADISPSVQALIFSKNFVVFCIVLVEIQEELKQKGPTSWISIGLAFGIISASLDMSLNLHFPGIQLQGSSGVLQMQCCFDAAEVAVAIALSRDCATSLNNHLMINLLLGVATINLLERLQILTFHHAPYIDAVLLRNKANCCLHKSVVSSSLGEKNYQTEPPLTQDVRDIEIQNDPNTHACSIHYDETLLSAAVEQKEEQD